MTLAPTGVKPISTCSKCGSKDISEGNLRFGIFRCRNCERIANDVKNAVERMGEQIAGGRRAYRALPAEKRRQVREHAEFLYELGHQVSHQEVAESALKCGFVYVITNPAWPDHVKIGRAFDPEDRLAKYQTSCPYREYELFDSVYFEDCHSAERSIHAGLSCLRQTGEWYRLTSKQAMQIINQYKETYPCGVNSSVNY